MIDLIAIGYVVLNKDDGTATHVGAATTQSAANSVPRTTSARALRHGTPTPIIAVFGTDSNRLTGSVPDQASKDKLQALMIASSKTPVPVNNLLTIDPTVPPNNGVRRRVDLSAIRAEQLEG